VLPSEADDLESVHSDSSTDSTSNNGDQDLYQSKIALEGIRDALNQLSSLAVSIRQSATSTSAVRLMAFREKEKNQDHFRKFGRLSMLIIESLYPNAAESLRDRLSKSIHDRYAQLMYWSAHDRKLQTDSRPFKQMEPEIPYPLTTTRESRDQYPPGLQEHGAQRVNTFKSVLGSDTEPTTANTRPREAKEEQHKAPKPPATSARFVQAEFPRPPKLTIDERHGRCPFCCKFHSREQYEDMMWWEYVILRVVRFSLTRP
jgi:hypothetical protein